MSYLPCEMWALIASYSGSKPEGDYCRKQAANCMIKDVLDNCTYCNGVLHSFNDKPALIKSDGTQEWY